jgi:predicted dehydrogenase
MRRHKVLILGVGSIGERHLRCFQATGRAELSLVEINETLRRSVAERYRVRHAFADLDAALADRPDVAVVAVPASLHIPLALRLAEAGVHLLIEKPLSTTLDGIDRLRRIVQERRLVAATAYVYRCHPQLAAMRQAILAGCFGAPVEVTAVCGQHFPTYRPAYRSIYYADRAAGGGAIQDALTHIVNAGEWLVGPVTRLVADAAHQVLEGVAVEDTTHLLTRHGRVLGCYSLNQHQAPNEITLTVVCERGTARFEPHENCWRWMIQPGEPWRDERIRPLERDTLFLTQANTFLNAVEGQASLPCSLEEGVQTLRVNLAALASVADGAWRTIDTGAT